MSALAAVRSTCSGVRRVSIACSRRDLRAGAMANAQSFAAIAALRLQSLTSATPSSLSSTETLDRVPKVRSGCPSSPLFSSQSGPSGRSTAERYAYSTSSSALDLRSSFAIGGHGAASLRSSVLHPRVAQHRRAHRRAGHARADATVAEKEPSVGPAEKFEYQAEVSRLLDLIVHSLYSHPEVFLRELISNASDALDKLRFLSVTDASLLAGDPELEIRVKADKEAGTIEITDTGIGMTREELVESLGTIAQSGTAKFVQALKDNKEGSTENNLIGQFGVGFYSAFLVADKVTVTTKSPKSGAVWEWESVADSSSYTIKELPDAPELPRGTKVTLHLKPDCKFEYTEQQRVENLIRQYSQFISFPIYTWKELSRDKEKKKKTITEKYFDWDLINNTKPIWMRNPKDVSPADYNSFFKSTFNEFIDPAAHTHFSTEGEIEFRSLLYVPGIGPFNQEEIYNPKTKNIRLYVKRVFISDEFDGELFPRYLNFIKGVVDSNDLPLNVSREILQESRIVRIMKKRLVRKTFDMIDEIAKREKAEDYQSFWTNFGRNIKMGCIEDAGNHVRLAPLLRFYSNKGGDELVSLPQYLERMKPNQSSIYYLAADSLKSAKSAPFLEELEKKDFEVLFLVEPIDEVAITNLQSFKEKKFADISKEGLDLGEEVDKKKEEEKEKSYRLLCDWMKQKLGDRVAKVQVSNRISSSPCILVSGKFGWSANMERIMKAQAMGGDSSQLEFMKGRRILEINTDHPIIKDLNVAARDTPNNDKAANMVELLYETSLLTSGFSPENPSDFASRVYEMMALTVEDKRNEERAADEAVRLAQAKYGAGTAADASDSSTDEVVEPEVPSINEVVEPEVIESGDNDPWKS
ncbi:hypothetical protein CBR_g57858 [Chara braunii]|uniref:Histidine kinase/HSP90-like ATPase domain-containing protein n=1 Tax=Chara braunii TaxID=69332 RepID=A0A388K877_CHABU|nr:hypothetical protein CBR_g57858 [Chara braunii]|eukprot:GBG66257.1 hypothetical protein CBR_g57858 [Chara braunii]